MPKAIRMRVVELPGQDRALPRAKWTPEERAAKKCERFEQDYFESAHHIWNMLVNPKLNEKGEPIPATKAEQLASDTICRALDPNYDGVYTWQDGDLFYVTDEEYSELLHITDDPQIIGRHPLFGQLLRDIIAAVPCSRGALKAQRKGLEDGDDEEDTLGLAVAATNGKVAAEALAS